VKASVVITNFETWPATVTCLRALERHSAAHIHEIVVVDDASTTPPPGDLPAGVRVLRNDVNRGYVASVNVGFRAVSGDWVLLLDSDAYPKMDVVLPLSRSFAADPAFGAIALQTVDTDGRPTATSYEEPDVVDFILGPRLDAVYVGLRQLVLEPARVLASCALAVRRSAFESIGGFDESFDFLDADFDFSMRLSRAGWQTCVDRSLVAFHVGSGSPQTRSRRVLRHYENRWRLLAKHQKLPFPAAVKTALSLRHLLEAQTLLVAIGATRGERRAFFREKLRVRRRLLGTVWSGYRHATG
jgi:GT2 family glycosyltransferase